ncbi:hypothetical protein IE4872_CH01626 [Rhizobium gallicum]|uniref:Uncharacterized protein n=1 Tax=Rhizobium gallicum TaxID=56730 RepID=A0A1L5NHC7_9HYPH|nr:hypothetical protein [Rhizobium gallicum]APO67268.1 hypothetical protein IE4872_CH01626 [Rhizobium gallicum]
MPNTSIPANGEAIPTRLAIAESIEDLGKARSMVLTVWLALASPNFDKSDADDVKATLYEAYELIAECYRISSAAKSAARERAAGGRTSS